MFCNTCGTANADHARFCIHCGTALAAQPAVLVPPSAPPAAAAPAPVTPAVLPAASPLPAAAGRMPQTSGKAVASMVMGLGNFFFAFLFFPLAILAVIFGHISRAEIRKSGGTLQGDGLALTGLISGYFGIAIWPLFILAAIAIPSFVGLSGRHESSAISSVRTIVVAAETYNAQFPEKGYPSSLAALGPSPSGGPEGAGLIDADLAQGAKQGYLFTYTAVDSDGDGVMEGYLLNADPQTGSGRRHFFVDQTGVVRFENGRMATAESQQLF